MLILALACLRLGSEDETFRLVRNGQFLAALRMGMARLDKRATAQTADEHAMLGHVLGHVLIALDREAEAEQLFQRQLHVYALSSREHVRWLSSLDQGLLQCALNRPSRAAMFFLAVAEEATPVLQIEALAGLAACMRKVGEYRRSERALLHARALARDGSDAVHRLLDAMRLETAVLGQPSEFNEDIGAAGGVSGSRPDPAAALHTSLLAAASRLRRLPLASRRLRFLAALVDPDPRGAPSEAGIAHFLRALRTQEAFGLERQCRIEAALGGRWERNQPSGRTTKPGITATQFAAHLPPDVIKR